MKVVIENDAFMPEWAHEDDAGLDLFSRSNEFIPAGGSKIFDTGVHVELPKCCCGLIVSKSGLYTKHGLISTGLIDPGYTGSIRVKLCNLSNEGYVVQRGDKISQMLMLPFVKTKLERVDELAETERGNNGFGSTGR